MCATDGAFAVRLCVGVAAVAVAVALALASPAPAPPPDRGGSEAEGATEAAAEGAEGAPVNPLEAPCLREGGVCLLEAHCPEGRLSEKRGLCPAQRLRGVECCHGLSVQERRCSARGGVCRPRHKCGRALVDSYAEDCAFDEACCVLVA